MINAALKPFGIKLVRRRRLALQSSGEGGSPDLRQIELGDHAPSPLMVRSEMTLRDWSYFHSSAILGVPHSEEDERGPIKMKYFGIAIRKNPLDMWIFHELIYDLKPDLIVEIGSAHGGSTLWLAHQLDLLGKTGAKIISIDVDRKPFVASHPRIIEFTGDSASKEIVSKVKEYADEADVVMFLHDGGHHADQVLADLRAYADMVTPRSYFIVEDGLGDVKKAWGNSQYTEIGGPLIATLQFLEERSDFTIDYDCERYILTQNNLGFLRRS
jgi:cephalosporin hydroxylase